MRVFISWAGETSGKIAQVFRDWLPSALQYVKPFHSDSDIEKGSNWANEISKNLSASGVCIIIVTRETLDSNWVMFEAGAVSAKLDKSRVCPVMFNVVEADLKGPLTQLQATKFSKGEIKKLLDTINSAAGDSALDGAVLNNVFEKWWPELESEVSRILSSPSSARPPSRSERDMIEEILLTVRSIASEKDSREDLNHQMKEQSIYKFFRIDEDNKQSVGPTYFDIKLLKRALANRPEKTEKEVVEYWERALKDSEPDEK